MIKVTVFYPNGDGKTFDIDYYCNKHIPMVQETLGDAIKGVAVEKGLAGGTPDAPAAYMAIGNLYFESIEAFQTSFLPHLDKFGADIPNFTNVEPEVQLSEVCL